MKLTADDQGRIACRALFPPRKVIDAAKQPDGSMRVVEWVEKRAPRAKLVRRGKRTYLQSDRAISNAEIDAVMSQFP